MHCPNPEALSFLAPGLLHQFGNLLLSIHGSARLLEGDERVRRAICDAADRGGATLELLRLFVTGAAPVAAPVGVVLERLAELARMAVRDAGLRLELRPEGSAATSPVVDAGGIAWMTTEAIRRLLLALPAGAAGTLVVGWVTPCPGQAEATVHFEPGAGTLPFPVRGAALPDQLADAAVRLRISACCRDLPMGVAVRVSAAGAARSAEA